MENPRGPKKQKKTARVNSHRAKLRPEKGGMGIMDIVPFWMATKLGWLRKILQKDYLEEEEKVITYIFNQ